ncbi:hypothetical protein EDC04DRAFT_2673511 [Pisolithus marmoratus]|nr:hypothetical protein EDC04DRAFT_2673511 [Pisolithus marmoratus]
MSIPVPRVKCGGIPNVYMDFVVLVNSYSPASRHRFNCEAVSPAGGTRDCNTASGRITCSMGCTMALSGPIASASLRLQVARHPAPSGTHEYALQDNVIDSGGGGIFAGNGAPTLIVIFLAIAIFTVATAVAFSWRRRLDVRMFANRPTGVPVQTRRGWPETVCKKPILWDIWTQTSRGLGNFASQQDLRMWENVMPLAAVESNLVDLAKTIDERRPTADTTALRAVLSTVKRHYQPSPPGAALPYPRPPTTGKRRPSPSPSESQLKERPPHLLIKRTSIQIAVTITMPSLSTRVLGKSDFANAKEELVEFCVGTVEIPLREG